MNEVLDDLSSLRFNRWYHIWEPFMRKYRCNYVCEIGIRLGYNFEKMIKHQPAVAVAVDIWRDDGIMAHNDRAYSQERLDAQYNNFAKRVADKPFVQILREYSFEAVKRFPDDYFDFIYIDADHTFEGCYQDIIDWYPKVKKGGFLLGDDYSKHTTLTRVKFGVIEAVNKFADDNSLSFFVFPKSKWGMIKK